NTPVQYAAVEVSPPTNCCTRCGSTGMITPNASTSISTVTKMKASAALRAPVARGAFKRGIPGSDVAPPPRPAEGKRRQCRAKRRSGDEGVGGQPLGVLAHVVRPAGDLRVEAADVAGEQRARGFLETGFVAGHRLHEAIGGLLRGAAAVVAGGHPAGFLHQL